MYLRPEDRARPNRMALRIAVVGGFAVALFGILFFRLWDLQILEGAENLAQAKNNRTRSTKVVAPRGEILYNNGEVLVDNRTSLALQVDTSKLPEEKAAKNAELKEIGELVHMKLPQVLKVMKEEQEVVAAGAPLTIRQGVGYDLIYYIEEHKGKFPGVTVEKVFVRNYPKEDQAAQILGHTGEVSEEELEPGPTKAPNRAKSSARKGSSTATTSTCAGRRGRRATRSNAMGEPTPGGQLTSTPPTPGDNLKLSINQAVQEAGESALAQRGLPGAFVSMNIHTGEILGMGSSPTYDPSVWVNLSQKHYEELSSEENGDPLFNRATSSAYPTGSTYKIITALAGLENGSSPADTVVDDTGKIEVGGQTFENSEGEINGPITPGAGAGNILRRLLLHAGLQNVEDRLPAGMVGEDGDRPADRDRPAARGRRRRPGAEQEVDRRRRSERQRIHRTRGGRARTSSWRSARVTCRPTRWRWRSPTRRSATAARSSPRTSARKCRTRPAGSCGKSTRARGAT